jgi:hypothetical protein
MEESVVTFSGQRRKEPLVGDLVSLPEIVRSSMEKREDAVLGMDIEKGLIIPQGFPTPFLNQCQVSDLPFTLPSAAARGA